ncbi:Glycosyl transferases group 1 [Flexibacter flexilis DSM 6793]|uniref:Glycosyl transferases group 1 n=1 Tax=Flexibacter flexilis DSM 6793 TaxID=927664 RepID=A0A1I1D9G3_9BACT|nr:glycosyltransferase [Flexibacter flexilis]SFB71002.1 Glycosyl transferases group 1 [Flexibacter flexilis DSM 6793]
MAAKKIVFIGNEAKRTGAPILMLHFLRWIKQHTDTDGLIILRRGGVLEPEFEVIYPTYVWKRAFDQMPKSPLKLAQLAWFQVRNFWMQQSLRRKSRRADAIYANTIASADIVAALSPTSPVLLHIHELAGVLETFLQKKDYQGFKQYVSHYVCVSEATQEFLQKRLDLSASQMTLRYGFIPQPIVNQQEKEKIRQRLGLPQGAFVVGASGAIGWRKGSDLFVQMAAQLLAQHPEMYFVWVGGGSAAELAEVQQLCQEKGIAQRVFWTGNQPNPADYYALFDVFLLSSREDPFPLVCLENAALGKPIICFEKAGGMPELVSRDCGVVVPYLDVAAMAEAVEKLSKDKVELQRLGENARKIIAEEFLVEKAAASLWETLQKTIN